jgi:alpha-glucosidase
VGSDKTMFGSHAATEGERLVASTWWQRAVVYQVYPRSFADGNGDGVGDLLGLIERLDHLAWLGVDAVWISPVFRSPMADFGYDVADYCDIDPLFGDLATIDRLIADAHARDIKVLLDWVPNHTSDQHPWFLESRRDRTNPKADWYVWRDRTANNWLTAFNSGQPAWTYDEQRGQYYLHCFLAQQPDLNWDHPQVQDAMLDTLRFWLDRGVDGFRMDVIHLIAKHLDEDDPADFASKKYSHVPANDVPEVHPRLRRIRSVLDSYPGDRVSVGEVYLLDEERMAAYYGSGDELHLSFNFPFVWSQFRADDLRHRISRTLDILRPRGAWPTWVLSNHDVPRHRTRYGGDEALARIAAAMLLTLPGTPFLYQGEELGLHEAEIPHDRIVDPGLRDGCRAPLPWAIGRHHGWPSDPWLPFPPDADAHSVEAQHLDEDSMLHWYRHLMQVRRRTPQLHTLDLEWVDLGADVLAYRRGGVLVVLNMSSVTVDLPGIVVPLASSIRGLEGLHITSVAPLAAVVAVPA